jgi:hypothetical protein
MARIFVLAVFMAFPRSGNNLVGHDPEPGQKMIGKKQKRVGI